MRTATFVFVSCIKASNCLSIITPIRRLLTTCMSTDQFNDRSELENGRWEAMWSKGLNPGDRFDCYTSSPVLINRVKEGSIPIGRALVPGCGRGYDCTTLAASDRFVVGAEISPTALEAAHSRLAAISDSECSAKHMIQLVSTSFFDLPTSSPDQLFDFVYDYTFFCALHPSVREAWAQKMSSLIKKDGELLTLIFPIKKEPDDLGPPFHVTMDAYANVLLRNGFECSMLELLPPELCHPGRDGLNPPYWGSGVGRWKRL